MTLPGPHAMTAQAGAVAWPGEARPADDGDGYIAVSLYVEHRMTPLQARLWNSCRAACIAAHERSTPPAAVPVEALEGLVKAGKKFRAAQFAPHDYERSDAYSDLAAELDRIERLIKERSNG